jgi:hypothetical protein
MNLDFPVKSYPWQKVFKNKAISEEFIDLDKNLLMYEPKTAKSFASSVL